MNREKEKWLRLERTLCAMKDLCEGLSMMCGCENEKAHQFALHGAVRIERCADARGTPLPMSLRACAPHGAQPAPLY